MNSFGNTPDIDGCQIYSGDIDPEILNFTKPNLYHSKGMENSYVVKRLSNWQAFNAERTALEACNRANHAHIITLIASFDCAEIGHLLLPAAVTDLATFWRQEKAGCLPFSRDKLDEGWIIGQLAGLGDALLTFHTKLVSIQSSQLFGVHGDVKASNVLVFPEVSSRSRVGILQLADFGSSQLFHKQSQASNISPEEAPGSYAGSYAAPECVLKQPYSQAIDVWGFGCIILEALVWLLEGPNGLESFTDSRMHQSYPFGMDFESDFFFQLEPQREGDKHLKPWAEKINRSVTARISALKRHEKCSKTVTTILEVAEQRILLIDPRKRISAEDLCDELKDFTNSYRT